MKVTFLKFTLAKTKNKKTSDPTAGTCVFSRRLREIFGLCPLCTTLYQHSHPPRHDPSSAGAYKPERLRIVDGTAVALAV